MSNFKTSMPNSNKLQFYLAFSQIQRIGSKKIKLLLNYFDSIESAWKAPMNELRAAGMDEGTLSEFLLRRSQINPEHELEKLEKEELKAVTIEDDDYPALLKETFTPPSILYYRGDLNNLHEQAIAVVGSRKITTYGKTVVEKIIPQLVNQDIIIVSGLALGIDALAHATTINAGKQTVAVLGSGLDRQSIYPASNRYLVDKILEKNGLLISEYPIGMMPLRHNFPARNRIISGLSLGTLVVEAGERSGALITAKFALEQNREVFAVPGNINQPLSIGTNNLVKRGAKLVQSAEDILEELNIKQLQQFKKNQEIIPDTPEEGVILKHLANEPLHLNEIVKRSHLTTQEVNATLMMLEMKGTVRNLGNNTYSIVT